MGQQLPVSVILNYDAQEGTYSIDADKSFDATSESNVLSQYVSLVTRSRVLTMLIASLYRGT